MTSPLYIYSANWGLRDVTNIVRQNITESSDGGEEVVVGLSVSSATFPHAGYLPPDYVKVLTVVWGYDNVNYMTTVKSDGSTLTIEPSSVVKPTKPPNENTVNVLGASYGLGVETSPLQGAVTSDQYGSYLTVAATSSEFPNSTVYPPRKTLFVVWREGVAVLGQPYTNVYSSVVKQGETIKIAYLCG
ncbi:MAG: hypothetical protein R3A51_18620 [Nannocystaceae bacterium]